MEACLSLQNGYGKGLWYANLEICVLISDL